MKRIRNLEYAQIQLYYRILRWLADEEENLKAEYLPRIQFLIVEMSRKQFLFYPDSKLNMPTHDSCFIHTLF